MQTNHAAEAAILSRLVKPNRADFSPEVAEALLKLEFDQTDRDRRLLIRLKPNVPIWIEHEAVLFISLA
jgi:hypothetical protein